jgi:hypothetical protein
MTDFFFNSLFKSVILSLSKDQFSRRQHAAPLDVSQAPLGTT